MFQRSAVVGCVLLGLAGCSDDESTGAGAGGSAGSGRAGSGAAAGHGGAGGSGGTAGSATGGSGGAGGSLTAPSPPFGTAPASHVTLAGDAADVYVPDGASGLPVVIVLPEADVERTAYSGFATLVARHGFVLVVVDPTLAIDGATGLYADAARLSAWLTALDAQNTSTTPPLAGALDVTRVGLVGHGFGGRVAIDAALGRCLAPTCSGGYVRPAAIVAAIAIGAGVDGGDGGVPGALDNTGEAIALLRGDQDGLVSASAADATYDALSEPPRAIATLKGAGHYAPCDSDAPSGATPDPGTPTLGVAESVAVAGDWSAYFLRAVLRNDADAKRWFFEFGQYVDTRVTLRSEE